MPEEKEEAKEAVYTKPTSQRDLEARLEVENEREDSKVVGPKNPDDFTEEGYIGVDPIYQNHANDTEAPIKADEGPEAKVVEQYRESVLSHLEESGSSEEKPAEEKSEEPQEKDEDKPFQPGN